MDPITATALAALAGGLGSEAGRNAWTALTALVRRPFRRGAAEEEPGQDPAPGLSSGELEVAALESAPTDPVRAQALATALGVRAALDGEFRMLLDEWWQRAQAVETGTVHNSISGTVHGTAIQGRDFSGPLTIHVPRQSDTDGQGR
ncbi:hypothetical protein [Streptomyces sp. NPDC056144]|uniref:hypothetical protein n=1 Tax=unclassified Streptomyces TaxID=2593676 RepID=UPI0035D88C85